MQWNSVVCTHWPNETKYGLWSEWRNKRFFKWNSQECILKREHHLAGSFIKFHTHTHIVWSHNQMQLNTNEEKKKKKIQQWINKRVNAICIHYSFFLFEATLVASLIQCWRSFHSSFFFLHSCRMHFIRNFPILKYSLSHS